MNLRRAARALTAHYDNALRATGISATQLPLLAAIDSGVNTSITSLARELDLERTTISRELAILQRRNLIATEVGGDQRTTTLALTKAGRKALTAASIAWQSAHQALSNEFGDDELKQVLRRIRALARTAQGLRKP